jgi:AcrR family transcriptional regulator
VADLDLPSIAKAGLIVADSRGAKGFTMRAVAEVLGVTPMALYHHVENKQALVALVVDAVIDERPLPPAAADWADELWELARWMRQISRDHPAVSELRRQYPVWTSKILPITERWFRAWHGSGLPDQQAGMAAALSSQAVVGFVATELEFQGMALPDAPLLEGLPGAREVLTSSPDADTAFELVTRSVIDGLHARLASPGTR